MSKDRRVEAVLITNAAPSFSTEQHHRSRRYTILMAVHLVSFALAGTTTRGGWVWSPSSSPPRCRGWQSCWPTRRPARDATPPRRWTGLNGRASITSAPSRRGPEARHTTKDFLGSGGTGTERLGASLAGRARTPSRSSPGPGTRGHGRSAPIALVLLLALPSCLRARRVEEEDAAWGVRGGGS